MLAKSIGGMIITAIVVLIIGLILYLLEVIKRTQKKQILRITTKIIFDMTIKEIYEFAKAMNMEDSELYFDCCGSEYTVKNVYAFANMTSQVKKVVLLDNLN